MNATITRVAVAVIAGLAIVADAFLLFVKPHVGTQAATAGQSGMLGASSSDSGSSGSGSSSSGSTGSSGSGSGSADGTSGGNTTDDNASGGNDTDSSGSDTPGGTTESGTLVDGTYTSVASPNEYGEVQLQVVVKGGKITSVNAITYPNHTDRSRSISAQAIPELAERAISAQNSDIQFVSGATETSTAFVNSLQDAINQALNAGK